MPQPEPFTLRARSCHNHDVNPNHSIYCTRDCLVEELLPAKHFHQSLPRNEHFRGKYAVTFIYQLHSSGRIRPYLEGTCAQHQGDFRRLLSFNLPRSVHNPLPVRLFDTCERRGYAN